MKQKATYALFGGSFDPPHIGHKEIIKEVLKLDFIDRVLVVPTYLNPFKSSFSVEPKKRLELVKKSFKIDGVEISSYEIEQQRAVYTAQTLRELGKIYNIKAIVIGADNLNSIEKWSEFNYLNGAIEWIVVTRENIDIDCSKLNRCKKIKLSIDVSSSEIREGKKLDYLDKKIKKQVEVEYNLEKS